MLSHGRSRGVENSRRRRGGADRTLTKREETKRNFNSNNILIVVIGLKVGISACLVENHICIFGTNYVIRPSVLV